MNLTDQQNNDTDQKQDAMEGWLGLFDSYIDGIIMSGGLEKWSPADVVQKAAILAHCRNQKVIEKYPELQGELE